MSLWRSQKKPLLLTMWYKILSWKSSKNIFWSKQMHVSIEEKGFPTAHLSTGSLQSPVNSGFFTYSLCSLLPGIWLNFEANPYFKENGCWEGQHCVYEMQKYAAVSSECLWIPDRPRLPDQSCCLIWWSDSISRERRISSSDTIYLEFWKASDTVSHYILNFKLGRYKLKG